MCDLGRWETKVNERDKRIADLETAIHGAIKAFNEGDDAALVHHLLPFSDNDCGWEGDRVEAVLRKTSSQALPSGDATSGCSAACS